GLTILLFALAVLTVAAGCERTPEDLEDWRNAKGGVEKLEGWAVSDEEPEAVRIRAIEILVEDNHFNELQSALEDVDDDKVRAKMVASAASIVEEKWNKQDMPTLDEETAEKGGKVETGASESVEAKDAAYYLHPHADKETKKKFEAILADWLSDDWQLRDQLGRTTLGQITPHAGPEGREHLLAWLEETPRPDRVSETIAKHGKDKTKEQAAEVILKRAKEDYPDLNDEMQVALFKFEHEALSPFLKEIIEDEEASPQLVDRAMNALVRNDGERSAPFFSDLVKEEQGTIRWVSATRIIEVMGKPGFSNVASSLPVETDAYDTDEEGALTEDVTYFCNMYNTEMEKADVSSVTDQLKRGLDSSRWPARMLAVKCVGTFKASDLKEKVEELTSDTQQLPNWDEPTTLGDLAEETLEALSES
ncbi:MAG: hypothetical protein ACOCV2_15355, partial [Persicimonas sp.]